LSDSEYAHIEEQLLLKGYVYGVFSHEICHPHPHPPPSRGRELFDKIMISPPLAGGDEGEGDENRSI